MITLLLFICFVVIVNAQSQNEIKNWLRSGKLPSNVEQQVVPPTGKTKAPALDSYDSRSLYLMTCVSVSALSVITTAGMLVKAVIRHRHVHYMKKRIVEKHD